MLHCLRNEGASIRYCVNKHKNPSWRELPARAFIQNQISKYQIVRASVPLVLAYPRWRERFARAAQTSQPMQIIHRQSPASPVSIPQSEVPFFQAYPGLTLNATVASRDAAFRSHLAKSLHRNTQLEYLGKVTKSRDLLEEHRGRLTDVLLMDLDAPVADGLEVLKLARKYFSHLCVLAVSELDVPSFEPYLLALGFDGFVGPKNKPEKLLRGIERLQKRAKPLPPESPMLQLEELLNSREMAILRMISLDHSNGEIIEALDIKLRTLEGYKQKIKQKLNVRTFYGAVAYAARNGLAQ